MGNLVPVSNEPEKSSEDRSFRFLFLLIFGVLALMVLGGVLLQRRSERQAREDAVRAQENLPQLSPEPSPYILFTPDDVEVVRRWTLLSGNHPTVKFSCRLTPKAQTANELVLSYRTLGSPTWQTVVARKTRDNVWRVVLRDLLRDMPYECFFVAICQEDLYRSDVVVFHTGDE